MTWTSLLFYLVFLSQIFVLSFYFPEKLLSRMRHVLATYPPSEYPRLYPQPVDYYKSRHLAFKIISRLIFFLGFGILFALVALVDLRTFSNHEFISWLWPGAYGTLQLLPLMLLDLSEFGQFKMMRQANSATTRKAELRRRRLLDFVSPVALGSAVLLYLAAVLSELYVYRFFWETLGKLLVLNGCNLFFAAVGAWKLYGRKADPHQTLGDRSREIETELKALLYVSMALSAFFVSEAVGTVFNLDFLDATLMSVYFQVIAFMSIGQGLRRIRIEDLDFSVYKEDIALT